MASAYGETVFTLWDTLSLKGNVSTGSIFINKPQIPNRCAAHTHTHTHISKTVQHTHNQNIRRPTNPTLISTTLEFKHVERPKIYTCTNNTERIISSSMSLDSQLCLRVILAVLNCYSFHEVVDIQRMAFDYLITSTFVKQISEKHNELHRAGGSDQILVW